MLTVTKRVFLQRSVLVAASSVLFGTLPSLASAAIGKLPLRASAKTGNPNAKPGFKRRLGKFQTFTVEDAFRLANRHTEIQITNL